MWASDVSAMTHAPKALPTACLAGTAHRAGRSRARYMVRASSARLYSGRVATIEPGHGLRNLACLVLLAGGSVTFASCNAASPAKPVPAQATAPAKPPAAPSAHEEDIAPASPLPVPKALAPFTSRAAAGSGVWRAAGRRVHGYPAIYETRLVPPGSTQSAGIAWMDTHLLSARLYSGSLSPGGGPYRYTAPIEPDQAASLVAAFNGGFKMHDAEGGYYTEGRAIDPLRRGAASMVIYANGSVAIGAWGRDVSMTRRVVAVRQNLVPLVASSQPTRAAAGNWRAWGATCGATSCAASVPGIKRQWRSGLGITADGALIYAYGPALSPLQLARLLVRAGAVRGMQLDINPNWPIFVTYDPPSAGGLAAPSNGRKLLASTVQDPATLFKPGWARDFVTMSARPAR